MGNSLQDSMINSIMGSFKETDLLPSDDPKERFDAFKESWEDPAKRIKYEALKGELGEKYMTDPAKYVGFIEESPAMHKDVISAADETGIDPAFLYNVVMQEGLSSNMSLQVKSKKNIYYSDDTENTYGVGMDAFFMEQDLALQRGYLKEEIYSVDDYKETVPQEVQAGMKKGIDVEIGRIEKKDIWRGIGAMLKLNQDYLTSSFKKEGIDFNSISKETQQFWMYAAYNAGAGSANELLKSYGADPFSNPKFIKKLKKDQEYVKGKDSPGVFYTVFNKDSGHLADWMENVGRVVGGTELTNLYSPFSEKYKEGE